MLSKGDWMDIKAQIEQGVYPKDIAASLGVLSLLKSPSRQESAIHLAECMTSPIFHDAGLVAV